MATYAIGDIQGCFSQLAALLKVIQFDEAHDHLWFTGDLVNRGSESLATLRFIKQLGNCCHIVLGNHDLHLLAVAHNGHPGWPTDTLNDILTAADRHELLSWLIKQPLLHHDSNLGFTMVHAGLAHNWDLDKARKLAKEVETVLQSPHCVDFFKNMYGNYPNDWDDHLEDFERLRTITNFFTRMRFCHHDGRLELKTKGTVTSVSKDLIPWFRVENRLNKNLNIIFGHWAALNGVTDTPHVYALDTGCVWGHKLKAMRLEDKQVFFVSCAK